MQEQCLDFQVCDCSYFLLIVRIISFSFSPLLLDSLFHCEFNTEKKEY